MKRVDPDRAAIQNDLILRGLDAVARQALMGLESDEFKSDFALRHIAQGREKGREEGLRTAVGLQLGLKFGPLDRDLETRIAEAEAPVIERGLGRVLTATTVAEVFDD